MIYSLTNGRQPVILRLTSRECYRYWRLTDNQWYYDWPPTSEVLGNKSLVSKIIFSILTRINEDKASVSFRCFQFFIITRTLTVIEAFTCISWVLTRENDVTPPDVMEMKAYVTKQIETMSRWSVQWFSHKNIRIRSKLEAHHKQIYFRVDQDGLRVDWPESSLLLGNHQPHFLVIDGCFFPCKTMFKVQKTTVL